jgi:thiamine biosynthesis lipoprotein
VELDLGATAKALGADRAAARVAGELGAGAMVSFGGDVAVAGTPPAGGWPVRVTDHHASGFQAPGQTISIATGGLATSSTTARRWAGPDHELHHILDPRTGRPVPGTWRTASVAAATCLDANVASTAAVIQGVAAPGWLERLGLPARLAGSGDRVVYVGNWPRDEAAA